MNIVVDGKIVEFCIGLFGIGAIVGMKFTCIKMMPGTSGCIAIARNQRNIPKSAKKKKTEKTEKNHSIFNFNCANGWHAFMYPHKCELDIAKHFIVPFTPKYEQIAAATTRKKILHGNSAPQTQTNST